MTSAERHAAADKIAAAGNPWMAWALQAAMSATEWSARLR